MLGTGARPGILPPTRLVWSAAGREGGGFLLRCGGVWRGGGRGRDAPPPPASPASMYPTLHQSGFITKENVLIWDHISERRCSLSNKTARGERVSACVICPALAGIAADPKPRTAGEYFKYLLKEISNSTLFWPGLSEQFNLAVFSGCWREARPNQALQRFAELF